MAGFLQSLKINSAEFFFIFVVSSFVIHEIFVEWAAAKNILYFVPGQINKLLGTTGELAYFIRGTVLFIFLPAIIFLIPSMLAKITGKMSLLDAAKKFSILILPVMAAGHVMKSLFKITSRIPYYEFLGGDPLGINTANLIYSGQIQLNKNIVNLIFPILGFIAIFLFLGALIFSSVLVMKGSSIKISQKSAKIPPLIGLFLYTSIFLIMIIFWRF